MPLPRLAERASSLMIKPRKRRGAGIHRIIASIPDIRSAQVLQERIVEAMSKLLHGKERNSPHTRRCCELYKDLEQKSKAVCDSYEKFSSAWRKMGTLLKANETWSPERVSLLRKGGRGTGITLIPSTLVLPDKKILPFARHVMEKLQEFDEVHEDRRIHMNDQKELAIDLLLIADDYLPLEEIPVQRAIERTASAYISRSGKHRTGTAGSLWGLTPVAEERYPAMEALHETIQNLLRYQGLQLDEEDIEYCAREYGADPSRLQELAGNEAQNASGNFSLKAPMRLPSINNLRANTIL